MCIKVYNSLKKGVLSGPSWPFVDQKRFSPRPFVDRPNHNRANLSSDHRHRALVQRLPSPLDPCNRSYNAPTSTHDFPAPLPSRKSPHNPANPASDNKKSIHFSNARFCCMIPVISRSTARASTCRMSYPLELTKGHTIRWRPTTSTQPILPTFLPTASDNSWT